MDPLIPTPYPTALFIRERAMVVNFESIRMIIAADQVCSDAGLSKKILVSWLTISLTSAHQLLC